MSCVEFNYRAPEKLQLKVHFFKIAKKTNSFKIHLKRCKYKYKSLEYTFYMHNKNIAIIYSLKCDLQIIK